MKKRKPPACRLSKVLGENIRKLRGTSTLEEFAPTLGLSKSTLQRIELGAQNTSVKMLETICDHLGYEVGKLFASPSKLSSDRTSPKQKREAS